MNKKLIIASAILFLPMAIFAKSEKRGVSENNFQSLDQLEGLSPGVGWYYNWGNKPGSSVEDQDYMTYLPMCWNANYNTEAIRDYYTNHPEAKYILGFNEPNFKAQANMTPQQAAEAWPAVQAIAKEFGLEIVAPALNYSPDAPYTDPLKWMDEFVNLVGLDAFDYTAVHAYGGFGVMSDLATKFHDRYGKDVWVTEFCYWPGESGYQSPETQIAFMVQALEWLEKTEWIHKYAWFKALGAFNSSSAPNFGLIMTGKKDEYQGNLSDQGKVYVHLSNFDPEVYHPINKSIPATEYINRYSAGVGASKDSEGLKPIEISSFNGGAYLDYQFDVPKDGAYELNLRVSGMGDPSRFNPNIGVVTIKDDGTDGDVLSPNKEFTLTNDDTKYVNVTFPMTLKAGKQTIRVKDFAPYMPSGIRISSVMLADPAGVEGIMADAGAPVNVYNLQGVCVLKNANPTDINGSLTPGIYVISGKKIYIK